MLSRRLLLTWGLSVAVVTACAVAGLMLHERWLQDPMRPPRGAEGALEKAWITTWGKTHVPLPHHYSYLAPWGEPGAKDSQHWQWSGVDSPGARHHEATGVPVERFLLRRRQRGFTSSLCGVSNDPDCDTGYARTDETRELDGRRWYAYRKLSPEATRDLRLEVLEELEQRNSEPLGSERP